MEVLEISVAQSVIIIFSFYISLKSGVIQVDDRGVSYLIYFITPVAFLPLLSYLSSRYFGRILIYLESLEIFLFSLLLLVFLKFPVESILMLVSISLAFLKIENPRRQFTRISAFLAISVLMYFLGESLQFIFQPYSSPVTMIPLKYVYILPGSPLPWIYTSGFNLAGTVLTLTISPLILLIFSAISIISTDNFFKIYFLVKRGRKSGFAATGMQGAAATLSCQCEGCIAVLPSVSAAILSLAMIPLIMESSILLLLTNAITSLVATRYHEFSMVFTKFTAVMGRYLLALTLISIPVLSSVLALEGYFRTPLFIFGIGMIGALAGYLCGARMGRLNTNLNMPFKVSLVILGLTGILLWYIPFITIYVVNDISVFIIMNSVTLLSGVVLGIMRWQIRSGYLIGEISTLAIGLLDVSLFYISIQFRFNPWSEFTYSSLLIFEIIAWGVMVPAMWISTQQTLIDASGNGLYLDVGNVSGATSTGDYSDRMAPNEKVAP
jgi:hypothetical protein